MSLLPGPSKKNKKKKEKGQNKSTYDVYVFIVKTT